MGHCAEMGQRILPTLSKDAIAKLNIIITKANMIWILWLFKQFICNYVIGNFVSSKIGKVKSTIE